MRLIWFPIICHILKYEARAGLHPSLTPPDSFISLSLHHALFISTYLDLYSGEFFFFFSCRDTLRNSSCPPPLLLFSACQQSHSNLAVLDLRTQTCSSRQNPPRRSHGVVLLLQVPQPRSVSAIGSNPARGDRLSSSPASAPSSPDPPCLTD